MNNTFYRLLVGAIDAFLWGGELIGDENLPEKGPAVFIANHLGPTGPIGAVCSIPLRLHAWIRAEMVDKERAAAYLNWDFVEPRLKLKPPFSLAVAKALSKITVPMLTSLGCLPAFQGYEDIQGVLKTSVSLLEKENFILICPEDPILAMDPVTKMTPFKKGFARLGEMYFEATKQRLDFYPVAIHDSRKVMIGKPIAYNPLIPLPKERLRIKRVLEETIAEMYLQMASGDTSVPLGEPESHYGRS